MTIYNWYTEFVENEILAVTACEIRPFLNFGKISLYIRDQLNVDR